MLLIVFPLSRIFLPNVTPVHSAVPLLDIFFPQSFEVVPRGIVVHLTEAILHIALEAALKYAPALEDNLSFPVFFALKPAALVHSVIYRVLAMPMPKPITSLSFIDTPVWPAVHSFTSNPVVSEFPFVDDSICPGEFTLTAEQTIVEVAFVLVAVLEGDATQSVEAPPVNLRVLRRYGYLPGPALIENLGELDR